MNQTESIASPLTYNRAKTWQIAFFSLNNSATNLALFLMMYYAYFTQNVLGLAAVIIGLIATLTRVFDGITDPIIAFFVDKTNGRFGRFRPYMLLGNLILIASMTAIFFTPAEWTNGVKYAYTAGLYFIYVIGYTFQTIATKAAQSVLTNDPKQRPLFSGFDGFLTQLWLAFIPFLITTLLARRFTVSELVNGEMVVVLQGLLNPALWKTTAILISGLSLLCTILAMIGIAGKDKPEFYTQQKQEPVKFKDYWDIICHNRPLQMLIISAATDKLGALLVSGTATYIFANLLLDSGLNGVFSSVVMIPLVIISIAGVLIARKVGLKRMFLLGTWASMLLLVLMYILRPNPALPWLFLAVYLLQKCAASMANAAVIPMIADCTDYENYRSGRFVPSMIGTLFSFVDKLISSASGLVVGLALTLAGVGNSVITPNQPMNATFNAWMMACFCLVPILGHLASIIAMRFYHLTREKMAEIQQTLHERKQDIQKEVV